MRTPANRPPAEPVTWIFGWADGDDRNNWEWTYLGPAHDRTYYFPAQSSISDLSVLGLRPGFTQSDLRRAHRLLVLVHHPDRGGNSRQFIRIQKSYEALSGTIKELVS